MLTQHGELADAGGKELVQQLPNAVPAPGNARHYAQIVKQNALLRRLLGAAQTIQHSVHERDGEHNVPIAAKELVAEAILDRVEALRVAGSTAG